MTHRHLKIQLVLLITILPLTVGIGPSHAQQSRAQQIDAFTEPYRDIDVAGPEMGTLKDIHVQEGDVVSAGQLLATLDDEVLQASLKMAKSGMESEGKLNSALAELRLHTERLKALVELQGRRHATHREVERTRLQKEIAEADVQSVREELRIKSLEYQRIQAQLDRRKLRSPIQGVVTYVHKDQAEFISASDPVVVKVVQLDPLLVVFSVPAADAQNIQLDQELPVYVGQRTSPVMGIVEFVSPTADAQSGTTRVKVRLGNSDGKLQSGEACRLDRPKSTGQLAKSGR